jgi:hypothetical protein
MTPIFDRPPTDEEYLRQIILQKLWEVMPNESTFRILKLADQIKEVVYRGGYRHAVRAKPDRE